MPTLAIHSSWIKIGMALPVSLYEGRPTEDEDESTRYIVVNSSPLSRV
jgi:hypothetical protein